LANPSGLVPGNFHENTIQHLSLIQGVINRLGTNSGLMKGFAALVMTSTMMIPADTNVIIISFLLVMVFAFAILDGYYLAQERRYRALYEKVRTENNNGGQSDFALKIDLRESEIKQYSCSTLAGVVSKSVIPFYLPCLLFVGLIIYFKIH
jgi:hypothetical protein